MAANKHLSSSSRARQQAKSERLNASKQKRAHQREQQRVSLKSQRNVGVISLSSSFDARNIPALLSEMHEVVSVVGNPQEPTGYEPIYVKVKDQRMTLCLKAIDISDLPSAMDLVKLMDICVLVVSGADGADEEIIDALSTIKGHGVPGCIGLITDLDTVEKKNRSPFRAAMTQFVHYHVDADTKCVDFDPTAESAIKALTRDLCLTKLKPIAWVESTGTLWTEDASLDESGALALTGFVRGSGLDPARVGHITALGDVRVRQVSIHTDPFGTRPIVETVIRPDPADELEPYAEVQEEAEEADMGTEGDIREKQTVTVPAGTSEYQAAWYARYGDGEDDEDEGMSDMEETSDEEEDMLPGTAEADEDMGLPTEDPTQATEAKRQHAHELREAAEEDKDFPDEVDTPVDMAARDRFRKYVGLKSLRSSPWRMKHTPAEYARLFAYPAFEQTRRAAMAATSAVEAGQLATVVVEPRDGLDFSTVLARMAAGTPVVFVSLKEHEARRTIVHARVSRRGPDTAPVPSKEPVMVHVGWRRETVHPIYYELPLGLWNLNQYKYSRFLHRNEVEEGVAEKDWPHGMAFESNTVFPPCPIVVFRAGVDGQTPSIARGKVTACDPSRAILKRVVMTGYPYRVKKNKAVVRFMFFGPEDVKFFKPIEMDTKHGLHGHITASLGTHGYFKAIFNRRIVMTDTVCMKLWRRVFPPMVVKE
ncbi:Protein of unknown function (DUF663) [Carpediemonas membranifera]|uniref:Bms1-type G domain-containing protein n=1 Tax=Carpediemonas membranifera TaxID=201153 RepID=A0A8J6ARK4_9EUKA|nr:Protein of unknown function (DUF663) [Carpediemonas membranifera]|eukprot:KAG9389640.1 Protein of unknown function (DUF663) [Carpediemonas membranifera]